MRLRTYLATLLLGLAACAAPAAAPLHPAVTTDGELDDEVRLSFFARFDERSFRALAERAYRDGNPEAEQLLNAVLWNWFPLEIELSEMKERRRRARLLLPSLTAHPDARVRAGAWRTGHYLYQEPATSAALSAALTPAIADPDPDVRLAAIRTSIDLHRGRAGGCIAEEKKTSFSLRPHLTRMEERLFVEPDARVRLALLWALAWGGRRRCQPAFVRYFMEADRREEIAASFSDPLWALCVFPEEGLDHDHPRPPEDEDAGRKRLRGFADSLQATAAARRNGIVLILTEASQKSVSLNEDRPFLVRVVDWLEREEQIVLEADLLLVLQQWRVMDPEKLLHEPPGFLRRSNLPELLKGLKDTLAALPH